MRKPTEISLFTAKEQELLVATRTEDLKKMGEDDLADLLLIVRRARNKYSGLHRRQSTATAKSAGKRKAASTSNQRTLRKAEILEDALSRVSLYLSRAARASANECKRERIKAAR